MGNVMNQGILGDALVVAVVGVLLAGRTMASDAGTQPTAAELEEITITAAKMRALEQFTPTGSRLGLSQQELSATLDVIDNDEMIGRGFTTFRKRRTASRASPRADRPAINRNFQCEDLLAIRLRPCAMDCISVRPTWCHATKTPSMSRA
jgi:hypothetical protein